MYLYSRYLIWKMIWDLPPGMLWWPVRKGLKLGRQLNVKLVCARPQSARQPSSSDRFKLCITFAWFNSWCYSCNQYFWKIGSILQALEMPKTHAQWVKILQKWIVLSLLFQPIIQSIFYSNKLKIRLYAKQFFSWKFSLSSILQLKFSQFLHDFTA